MGSSRNTGSALLGFLSEAGSRGAAQALRSRNLAALAGRPIEEIFLGLADLVCPDGGTIDDGIARNAFIETIAELATEGVTDLDQLTIDQIQIVLEIYGTNAIEARLCNDIGAKTVLLPSDARQAAAVQAQLHDFIRRAVADAITAERAAMGELPSHRRFEFITRVYEQAFAILEMIGDGEADSP